MTQQETESWLREVFDQETRRIPVPDDLASRSIERSHRGQRSKRVRRSIAATLAVCGVTAAVVVAVNAIEGSTPSPQPSGVAQTPTPSPTPSESKASKPKETKRTAFEWASSLPRGSDARAVFESDGTLYVGSDRYDLPGDVKLGNGVSASVRDGWRISWHEPGSGISKHGVMHPDGTYEVFPYPPRGARETFGVSPDGSQVIYDEWILDATTGEKLFQLPPNVGYIDAWTPNGITYQCPRSGQSCWWSPGGEPIELGTFVDLRSDGLGFQKAPKGCASIVKLERDGLREVMDYCAPSGDWTDEPRHLSPSGALAVTSSGRIISVPDGDEVTALQVPPSFLTAYPDSVLWEDEQHILFVIGDYDVDYRSPRLIVRCDTVSQTCERASPELVDEGSFIHPLPLSPGAPRDGTT